MRAILTAPLVGSSVQLPPLRPTAPIEAVPAVVRSAEADVPLLDPRAQAARAASPDPAVARRAFTGEAVRGAARDAAVDAAPVSMAASVATLAASAPPPAPVRTAVPAPKVRAVPGRSLGEYQAGAPWGYIMLGVGAVAAFALAAGPGEGVPASSFLPVLGLFVGGLITNAFYDAGRREKPLAAANRAILDRRLRTAVQKGSGLRDLMATAVHSDHGARFNAVEKAVTGALPQSRDFIELLGELAAAETVPVNVRGAISGLGTIGGPWAVAVLDDLSSRLPAAYRPHLRAARVQAESAPARAPAGNLDELEALAAPVEAGAGDGMAARVEEAVSALGDSLPERARAKALRASLDEWTAARGGPEESIALARLERLLDGAED